MFAALMILGALRPDSRAARSGLNNVPTADAAPGGAGVVQVYSHFGEGRRPEWLSGVRLGMSPALGNFEVGFDTRWQPGPLVPAFFNAKWAAQLKKGLPAVGFGVADLAPRPSDRDAFGQPQTYVVLSQDLDVVRVHAGYGFQARNDALFFGIDHWSVIANRKLTLRADITEIENGRQWLASAGFAYKLSDSVLLEVWQSLPTRHGRSYTTARLGFGFRY